MSIVLFQNIELFYFFLEFFLDLRNSFAINGNIFYYFHTLIHLGLFFIISRIQHPHSPPERPWVRVTSWQGKHTRGVFERVWEAPRCVGDPY